MARHVHLTVELTKSIAPGVITAAVQLRIRGVRVLDWRLAGLNGSALALARAAVEDHRAGGQWPLFFGAGSLTDRASDAADFSVSHQEHSVTLTDFRGCAVDREARFVVPWGAFADVVVRVGSLVARRSGTPAAGMTAADAALRAAWREELRERLRAIRTRRRALERMSRPR